MTRLTLAAALLVTALAGGCAGSDGPSRNKSGAESAKQTLVRNVLKLESTDGGSPEALHFARRIEARSGGTLRVEIAQTYPASLPANETRLARAIRAGRADFAILPARAWPPAGVRSFAALQAPFVLGNYEVAAQAVTGPAGVMLQKSLGRSGVISLALVPSQLRRLLAVEPLTTLADFRAVRIRISDSATSAAGVRALGADPVQGLDTDATLAALGRQQLEGVETSPGWAVANHYSRHASHLTGYALFDRVDTLVASSRAWTRLPARQRAVVRAAARDTVAFSETLPERDTQAILQLCRNGVSVTGPTAADLAALAEATEPVRAALRRDPETGAVMRLLEATPGAGPHVLAAPEACSSTMGRAEEEADNSVTLPEGVYVTTTTKEDYQSRGEFSWSEPAYIWTTRIRGGKWVRTVVPEFPDQVGESDGAGTYEVHGDEVTFRYTHPVVAASLAETLRWSSYEGRLTFEVVDVADRGARIIYTAHPWRKTG